MHQFRMTVGGVAFALLLSGAVAARGPGDGTGTGWPLAPAADLSQKQYACPFHGGLVRE